MLKVIGGAESGEFKAVASGTLPNGKPIIINSDGTASVAAETTASSNLTYGTFTNIENEATQYVHIAADPFNNNRFALVDIDDAGDKNVHLYIITRSGSSITVSPQIMVFASPGNNASNSMSVWDVVTENQLLICYNDDNNRFDAVVATISGSAGSETATFGTKLDVSNKRFWGGSSAYAFIKPIGTTGSYLALYRNNAGTDNYTYSRILSISGTTVSRDTAGGSDGSVLVSVNMQPVMHADIDPNDSTKGFAIGVNDSNEDLELYPLTFSGTGTGMTVSAGTKRVLKSGRNFLDSHSSPTIKYLTSSKLFVAAQSSESPNANELETFLFDYDGSTYTEYTSVFLANPDGQILEHYVDTTSPQADENSILVTINKNGSPRYVYGAVATCDTSANTVSYNTPARIDNYSGGNAGYISYATQSDAAGTSLNGFSGTDGSGNQRPYVRLTQKGGTTTNLTAENYIGISSGGAVADTGSATVDIIGAVADVPATSYDIANASYGGVSFSAAGQDGNVHGVTFNSDGTKMYVVGAINDSVYQYTLTTGYDLSTASYDSVSLSVASQDTNPVGLFFKSDGTKLYVVGLTNDNVYQYSLSTAFDLSTASYDSVSFSVASQDGSPHDIFFKSDGTRMFITGNNNDSIFQYTLSTAWDLSTASYDSVSFDLSSQATTPLSVAFKSDGTKMYIAGATNDAVYQYSLSTSFDLSTASYDNVSFSFASQTGNPYGLAFNNNGTKMYIVDLTGPIYQYSTEVTLTAGEKYYVQTDGTLSTTAGDPSVLAGTAIASTKLLVKT